MSSIDNVVQSELCIGCGLCAYVLEDDAEMIYSNKYGIKIPSTVIGSKKEVDAYDICPGKGVNIIEISNRIKGAASKYRFELGFVDRLWVANSTDPTIKENSTSGGVMTSIAHFMLQNKMVDGVITARMEYTTSGPVPSMVIVNTLSELIECQGSKYVPISFENILKGLSSYEGKLAIIAVPCIISSLRLMQSRYRDIDKIKYFISNFCGGMKNMNYMKSLSKQGNIAYSGIKYFAFRGDGQPGNLIIKDNDQQFKYPYPKYDELTGYSKMKRCTLCVDATGENSDISCGDAWLPEYLGSSKKWSLVLTRNEKATKIISTMIATGYLEANPIEEDRVIQSQKTNIYSKKYRQKARYSLYKMLGHNLPEFDGGMLMRKTSVWFEYKVYASHYVNNKFEDWGIYNKFRPFINYLRSVFG
jgi:coenzyme F420 hydrogenase subunit beta